MVQVPPGRTVHVEADAASRGSSTYVEVFDSWIGVGWLARGGAGDVGAAAEPCAPAGARSWFLPDGTTAQGEQDFVVVMNPYAEDAVFDVALLTASRAPNRDTELTDIVLEPRRSIAILLNRFVQGERAVGTLLEVSLGRVAVGSLGISKGRGIRSVVGSPFVNSRALSAVTKSAGALELLVGNPGEHPLRFGATLLSKHGTSSAGELTEAELGPLSTKAFRIAIEGPSALGAASQDRVGFGLAVRTLGEAGDSAATGSAPEPLRSWLVSPTVAGPPSDPGLVVANPGSERATVELRSLAGERSPEPITISIRAGSAVAAPGDFLDAVPGSAVMVTSNVPVIAVGASTSLGTQGLAVYTLALGVPIASTV
jgi:hypothetical protein